MKTALCGLGGDERDEFACAFLHALLGVFRNLGCCRQALFHDTADVGYWQEAL